MKTLLTRDEFREQVFHRDNYKCVICGADGKDAHHIIERRLWDDGGYYLENGATLCEEHHLLAEKTLLSCEEIRRAAGIAFIMLPPYFYRDKKYDKWGNEILSSGFRVKGELFFDESVQKVLADVMSKFTPYVKFPKIKHLPWSEGINRDDRVFSKEDLDKWFRGKEIVITEKLDGENTSIYQNCVHARSLDSKDHWSRSWVKNLQYQIGYNIPEGWRICGENVYATHSIKYEGLPTFFLVFSIYNDRNECLSWDETCEYAKLLDIQTVPELHRGTYEDVIWDDLFSGTSRYDGKQEGYVIRWAESFPFTHHAVAFGKWVRGNHVQTNHNWMFNSTEKNRLRYKTTGGNKNEMCSMWERIK